MQVERRIKRRQFILMLGMTILWIGLTARLWWIQLGASHRFTRRGIDLVKNSVRQRQQSIVLHSGRGDILDRNGYRFTGEEQLALILFPLARGSLQGTDGLKRLSGITGISEERLAEAMKNAKAPIMLRDSTKRLIPLSQQQAERINQLAIPGIVSLAVTERYRENEVAKHVVGYIHRNPELVKSLYPDEWAQGKKNAETTTGASGLERSFDRFLQGIEPSILSYYVDGEGNPMRGLDIRYTTQNNEYYPLSLVTTLDARLQRQVERFADEEGLNQGSIVVLDAESGDIRAMVSRPVYDQSRVEVEKGAWQNRAVKQLPPGSVFKIVVAAAALAEGVVSPTERFHCSGSYGKYGFSCWKKEGHGSLTMEEAFAQSCNITFAEIAKRVGGDKLDEYARRLGLQTQVGHRTDHLFKLQGFRQLDGEETGRVFLEQVSRKDEGVLIQTAIGQRDVRITPLQAANLMITILRGGQPSQVRLVSEITYKNSQSFYRFPVQALTEQGIDYVTASKLKRLLRLVVTTGTGKLLENSPWPIAGKSGTAQTGTGANERNHLWFAGYAPADKPRFAICVVAENQPAYGGNRAMEIFRRVVGEIDGPPV
ncbi:penicillin-binding protein 2 [Brevibacillus ruminantium]|uniref:Penicillin-binding protein 2 n=1 Tax=Brevibacillus ruminantium TaxID=2950604 RepID=A0ABY4WAT7_9BACL|nr:penicillin-binding protein 2 [Brevibacillus ruminantium]USG64044.1 penicillin-binding protein 2 [Brevibacillus ruminantium]